MINSGGAGGEGSGSNPDPPKEAKEAVNADPGVKIPSPKPAPPLKPTTYSQQAAALQSAASSGTPFSSL